jgi:vacuolar-type H+-ATPase subunit H
MAHDDSGSKSRADRIPLPPDANPPLEVIRAKEREIAERIAAAQAKADEMIAEARRSAATAIRAAEEQGAGAESERQASIVSGAQAEASEIRLRADTETEGIRTLAEGRKEEAVEIVLDAVVPAAPAEDGTR